MVTNAGIFEARALVTIVTVRTDACVPAIYYVTLQALLTGVGIAQVQHDLKYWKNKTIRQLRDTSTSL